MAARDHVTLALKPHLHSQKSMQYNPDKHHRHSIRLKSYNYARNGFYFITICSRNRE